MKKSMYISLNSIDDVKTFCDSINRIEGDVFFIGDDVTVNAKSILGIFSLNLTKPLRLKVEKWKSEYSKYFEKYLVKY